MLVSGWKIFCQWRGPVFEYRDAAKALPVIQQLAAGEVTFYRDQDWCRVPKDREGIFANTDRSTCALTGDPKNVKPLQGAALVRWQNWRDKAAPLPYSALWISLRYDGASGALSEAEVQLSTTWFNREALVYSAGYTLPPNEVGEILHTAIDRDWFHRWEDWNCTSLLISKNNKINQCLT